MSCVTRDCNVCSIKETDWSPMSLCSSFAENTWSVALLCLSLGIGLIGTLAIKQYPVALYVSLPVAAGLYATIGTTVMAGLQIEGDDIVNTGPRALAFAAWFTTASALFDVGLAITNISDRLLRGGCAVLLAPAGVLFASDVASRTMQAVSFGALALTFVFVGVTWRLGRTSHRPQSGPGRFIPEAPLAVGAFSAFVTAGLLVGWQSECADSPTTIHLGGIVVILFGSLAMLEAQTALVVLGSVVSGRDPVLHVPNYAGLLYLRFRSPTPTAEDEVPIAPEDPVSEAAADKVPVETTQTMWAVGDLGNSTL